MYLLDFGTHPDPYPPHLQHVCHQGYLSSLVQKVVDGPPLLQMAPGQPFSPITTFPSYTPEDIELGK